MPESPMRVMHRSSGAGSRYLPEGPRFLGGGRLLWITIQTGPDSARGELHVLQTARNENRTWRLPGRPGFALPTSKDTQFLLGMERSIGLFDVQLQRFQPLVQDLDGDVTGTILNDAALCRDGLVFGTKDLAFAEPKAGLWFLRRHDLRLFPLRRDQLCSNGKHLRPLANGRWELFDIDSPTRVVMRYELDPSTGTMDRGRIAVDLRRERAVPDGMAAVPGCPDLLAIAMFDPQPAEFGRVLWCHVRTGEVVRSFTLPGAAQVTCPAFVQGPQGVQMIATTAAERLSVAALAQQPNAGCLFVTEVDCALATPTAHWVA